MDYEERLEQLLLLREVYPTFRPFLIDGMEFLGFSTTWVQEDIAEFLTDGSLLKMVMAQRGQAKTTIVALYAVWKLIHNPKLRVLIVSAGGELASQIGRLVNQVIGIWDILSCLRGDKANKDRTSDTKFDVHVSLKGPEKSPSVASIGYTSRLQGRRADLLIVDDIEATGNSATAENRAKIMLAMADFLSICKFGQIVYLGTPQTSDSVYNTLPSKGFDVRIWTGRYPTPDQVVTYNGLLAPTILRHIEDDPSLQFGGGVLGDQGQPVDHILGSESELQRIELGQGSAYYLLQHMLSTAAMDANRFPLKTDHIIMMPFSNVFPMEVARHPSNKIQHSIEGHSFSVGTIVERENTYKVLSSIVMYIDPAGGGANGDETGYAVVGFLNGNLFVLDVGGIPGGYSDDSMNRLVSIAKRNLVNVVVIEKNMGYGAFKEILTPVLLKEHKCSIEEDYVTGQKERRIVNTLEPVMGRGSLVFNAEIIEREKASLNRYAHNVKLTYSLFYQINKVTLDRGALTHDDRLDALEGAVRYWVKTLEIDQEKSAKQEDDKQYNEWLNDPTGQIRRFQSVSQQGQFASLSNRR